MIKNTLIKSYLHLFSGLEYLNASRIHPELLTGSPLPPELSASLEGIMHKNINF